MAEYKQAGTLVIER